MILENSQGHNRYSRAFLNLKNVIELEKNDDHKFEKDLLDKFEELQKKYNSFYKEIPLIVVERYYQEHKDKMNKFSNLLYQGKEMTDLQIIDLFNLLEEFFNECFALACTIATMYNLEVKINSSSSSKENYL